MRLGDLWESDPRTGAIGNRDFCGAAFAEFEGNEITDLYVCLATSTNNVLCT